jgi:hypothetical protein
VPLQHTKLTVFITGVMVAAHPSCAQNVCVEREKELLRQLLLLPPGLLALVRVGLQGLSCTVGDCSNSNMRQDPFHHMRSL